MKRPELNRLFLNTTGYLCTMFRYITALVLLVAFAAQTFQRTVIVLNYYVNTASFAKKCENKARPMLHCNGKCQLMKKIREQEKKDQQMPERKLENKNEVVSSRSFFATVLPQNSRHPVTYRSFLHTTLLTGHTTGIFHPPCLV